MPLSIVGVVFWMLIIPILLGMSLTKMMKKEWQSFLMVFVSGYLMMFASFQFIYLWFVIFYNHFDVLSVTFAIIIGVLAAVSFLTSVKYWIKRMQECMGKERTKHSKGEIFLWVIVFVLLGFQLYKLIFYQFLDSDDAYYTGISVITNENLTMYKNIPYTGESSSLDQRRAFSSAPIFLSFLARMCNIHPTIITHSIYTIIVFALVYMLYTLIARVLLKEQKQYIPLFLIFINILYLFGNATIYTDATFLLTRTSQGKAFLANVIPAALILGLLLIWQNAKTEKEQEEILYRTEIITGTENAAPWIFLSLTMITAVYSSTMGLFLAPFTAGGAMLLLVLVSKQIKAFLPFFLSLVPMGIMGLLILKLM